MFKLKVSLCSQVYDQYLNFITLEDDMFILCHQNKELISYHGRTFQLNVCKQTVQVYSVFEYTLAALNKKGKW